MCCVHRQRLVESPRALTNTLLLWLSGCLAWVVDRRPGLCLRVSSPWATPWAPYSRALQYLKLVCSSMKTQPHFTPSVVALTTWACAIAQNQGELTPHVPQSPPASFFPGWQCKSGRHCNVRPPIQRHFNNSFQLATYLQLSLRVIDSEAILPFALSPHVLTGGAHGAAA